jgi:hypothetical protein
MLFEYKFLIKKALKTASLRHIIFLGVFFFISFGLFCQKKVKEKKDFPNPREVKNLLFYVQRTFNTNTLIYTLNFNDKEELDEKDPIKIYWINYAKDGSKEGLNFIQRKYAYGVSIKMIDTLKKSYCFNFVSYKKKQIFLIRSAVDNKYEAFSYINNKLIVLNRIFIQIEGGSFWSPNIKYIEITGRDPIKNEEVIEIVIP